MIQITIQNMDKITKEVDALCKQYEITCAKQGERPKDNAIYAVTIVLKFAPQEVWASQHSATYFKNNVQEYFEELLCGHDVMALDVVRALSLHRYSSIGKNRVQTFTNREHIDAMLEGLDHGIFE